MLHRLPARPLLFTFWAGLVLTQPLGSRATSATTTGWWAASR